MNLKDRVLRRFFVFIVSIILKLFVKLTITGQENLPKTPQPMLLIANHFSWFEAPLCYINLPYDSRWFAAKELEEIWLVRLIIRLFRAIPVFRGQVDRDALKVALAGLANGDVIGILPEGGIDPDTQERAQRGESVAHDAEYTRQNAELMRGRPGAGYLAVKSGVQILPVAFLHVEQVWENMKRLRRTAVTMHIGKPFGPMVIPPEVKGRARRLALQGVADEMMGQIAELMPAKNRGIYANSTDLPTVA
jgi:1-acyl-sn-glycerol-3-phosphate acyltransferase